MVVGLQVADLARGQYRVHDDGHAVELEIQQLVDRRRVDRDRHVRVHIKRVGIAVLPQALSLLDARLSSEFDRLCAALGPALRPALRQAP